MNATGRWNFRSLAGKVMAVLALAALVGSIEVAPAAAGDHGRGRYYENRPHDNRGPGHYRGHYRRGHVYRSYGYAEPVYAAPVYVAPPVYYAPPPAPGVSIFLPGIHIR
jgi:hypothetical protein